MTRSTVTVSTRSYEASHGRQPRGTGSWAFFFDGERDVAQAWWSSGSAPYREARAAAVAEARRRGASSVEVGS